MGLDLSDKNSVREYVWRRLVEEGVARPPFPVRGRIPNFEGAGEAAERLFRLESWRRARTVKVNPDSPQRPIRLRALEEGKLLIMPTPRIKRGFILLDPSRIPRGSYVRASTIRGAFRFGVVLDSLGALRASIPNVDLIVEGSVAVSIYGHRIGKGHGYGDLEWGILRELGKVSEDVEVMTTVHDLQVFDRPLPQSPHDLGVDVIATPRRLLHTLSAPNRPPGILWDRLSKEKIKEIPILYELWVEKHG